MPHAALHSAMPLLFVLLWRTGFIGTRLGLPHAEPVTFLAIRFALIAALISVLAEPRGLRGLPTAAESAISPSPGCWYTGFT